MNFRRSDCVLMF